MLALPKDVLAEFLHSYLNPEDTYNMLLVCKEWWAAISLCCDSLIYRSFPTLRHLSKGRYRDYVKLMRAEEAFSAAAILAGHSNQQEVTFKAVVLGPSVLCQRLLDGPRRLRMKHLQPGLTFSLLLQERAESVPPHCTIHMLDPQSFGCRQMTDLRGDVTNFFCKFKGGGFLEQVGNVYLCADKPADKQTFFMEILKQLAHTRVLRYLPLQRSFPTELTTLVSHPSYLILNSRFL